MLGAPCIVEFEKEEKEECLKHCSFRVMKVETTNLTSLPLCLAVVGIRTREIADQVRDRNLHTTNRQNGSETIRSLIQMVV